MDDIAWLRGLLPDPASAGIPLVSSSTTAAAFALLTQAGLAANSVGTSQLIDANVTTAKINALAVTAALIANGTITIGKMAALTDFLTWNTNLKGVQFSSGGAMFDDSSAEHTSIQAAGGVLRLLNEAGSAYGILEAINYKLPSLQSIISEVGTTNLRAQAVGNIFDVVCTDGLTQIFRVNYSEAQPFWKNTNKMWHDGNDGASSGLDADLLDGLHASEIVPSGLICYFNTATPPSGWVEHTAMRDRVPIGANATYTQGATGGAATYDHSIDIDHDHPSANSGVPLSGLYTTRNAPGGGTDQYAGELHAHAVNLPALGTTAKTTGAISHLPPYLALTAIRKS